MSNDPILVQLKWEDPTTGDVHTPSLKSPIAIGRETPQMPEQWGGEPVSRLELDHKQVSRYHALITVVNRQLFITDESANGTFLNGRRVLPKGQSFTSQDTLRIGPYKITAAIVRSQGSNSTELNLEHSQVADLAAPASPNTLLIWLAGVAILLLMGLGTWGIISVLLDQSRPQLEPETSHQSFPVHPS
ncbi:MAG: FHA domain-containing protein [Synechococcales bacterium]|nr:FHA domain-containing protein [Synechococcales bacterium]